MKNYKKITAIAFVIIFSFVGGYWLLVGSHAATTNLPGDINNSGKVDITDLSILLGSFGKTATPAQGDINSSGKVDILDLSILLGNFGKLPPTTPAPAGTFTVSGTKILDPTGHEFVPMGANYFGPHMTFYKKTLDVDLAKLHDGWKANIMRINTCMPGGCDYNKASGIDYDGSNDLDAIVKKYTDAGIVVMIDLHQNQFGRWPGDTGQTDLATIRSWWIDQATKYKDNPYVWFDLLNEPGNPPSNEVVPVKWRDIHRDLISAIRGQGANNMIIVEGTYWGQDAGSMYNTSPVPINQSAILKYGQEVVAGNKNVAFNIHVYNQWGDGLSATDAQREAKLADYFDRVHALGLPIFVGETGAKPKDGTPIDDTAVLEIGATKALYKVAPSRGVGIVAFAGQSNKSGDYSMMTAPSPLKDIWWGNDYTIDRIDSLTNPTNLNWHGSLMWAATRNNYQAPAR